MELSEQNTSKKTNIDEFFYLYHCDREKANLIVTSIKKNIKKPLIGIFDSETSNVTFLVDFYTFSALHKVKLMPDCGKFRVGRKSIKKIIFENGVEVNKPLSLLDRIYLTSFVYIENIPKNEEYIRFLKLIFDTKVFYRKD